MNRKYPNKEEILMAKIEYLPEELEYMGTWKNTYWRRARKYKKAEVRIYALGWLINIMASFHQRKVEVSYRPDLPSACYDPNENTIHLRNDSIISALHELAHAIYGTSELTACVWSVHLFKKFFPKSFKKLKWEGHMLKAVPNLRSVGGDSIKSIKSNNPHKAERKEQNNER